MDALHGSPRCWSSLPLCKSSTGIWATIVKTVSKVRIGDISLNQLFRGKVGDGKSIRFWLDPWACEKPLKDDFPLLFKREKHKRSMVFDNFNSVLGKFMGWWEEENETLTVEEMGEKTRINRLLEDETITNRDDKWEWLGIDPNGFSVHAVKNFLRSGTDYSQRFVFKWSRWVPNKCNILLWRMAQHRIPTVDALRSRNCFSGSLECVMCRSADESVEHIFCSCNTAMEVWSKVGRWCKLPPLFLFSCKDIFDLHEINGLDRLARERLKGIFFTVVWCLWTARNKSRFENAPSDSRKIVQDIKTLSFLWYSNRVRNVSVDWKMWYDFNFL